MNSFALTPEQNGVVTASCEKKILVTAGPGTGKTHTLIARLQHLAEQGHAMASEVLVLSFSRAAVRVVRDRVRGASEESPEVRFVRAATFDSFATQLLSRFDPDGTWTGAVYDQRIEAATGLLNDHNREEGQEARDFLAGFSHILIDEVQDLVGVRDRFVRAILETASRGDGGWTVFGDPAQAIYNFSLEGQERASGSGALGVWLRERFADQIQNVELLHNHRATGSSARKLVFGLAPFGETLRRSAPDYRALRDDLETLVSTLPALGELKDSLTLQALRAPVKTAILCRNNGQALYLSRLLRSKGVPHHQRRGATERALPLWIAHLLGDWKGTSISLASFEELCAARLPDLSGQPNSCEPQEMFRSLRRFCPGKGRFDVSIEMLGRRMREGNLPDELTDQGEGTLTISTIHRAKGLEFDRVLMVWSRDDWRAESGEEDGFATAEECRVLYVALTRPRQFLLRLPMPDHKGFLWKHKTRERWTRKYSTWKVGDIELRGDDSHALDPAGAFVHRFDVGAAQKHLLGEVRVGDPVTLELQMTRNTEGAPRAFYVIQHEDQPIGITGEAFGGDLYAVLKARPGRKVNWPQTIENLFIEGVDSVAGLPATSQKHGLGPNGLWLRARVSGLGKLGF